MTMNLSPEQLRRLGAVRLDAVATPGGLWFLAAIPEAQIRAAIARGELKAYRWSHGQPLVLVADVVKLNSVIT